MLMMISSSFLLVRRFAIVGFSIVTQEGGIYKLQIISDWHDESLKKKPINFRCNQLDTDKPKLRSTLLYIRGSRSHTVRPKEKISLFAKYRPGEFIFPYTRAEKYFPYAFFLL